MDSVGTMYDVGQDLHFDQVLDGNGGEQRDWLRSVMLALLWEFCKARPVSSYGGKSLDGGCVVYIRMVSSV